MEESSASFQSRWDAMNKTPTREELYQQGVEKLKKEMPPVTLMQTLARVYTTTVEKTKEYAKWLWDHTTEFGGEVKIPGGSTVDVKVDREKGETTVDEKLCVEHEGFGACVKA